ncbi:guanylate kinase [Bariatricus massiliensis]|uniref:Guanylate kinase n=1 Tax=Bariatricus massiliensis TaxID=1745713 RepID=A0ABS8DJG8_9FIRM|nr:guanylate kinase [Bariatricus massiliensis]MCB7305430.1 guanylate kinase [Bariatricus massiliensis]MCB7375984.1 guanylate kinase [Bariatricus massiliensis]MCB7388573.1 guanylate kinase [Bariatricus massiliensis]MCB7412746.1 guanylate kinase [Bariatricus massiliensis]MCQ5252162.1 guanylate kinase [Bariatricus massiliensis]
MNNKGILIVVSGFSGAGKGTLMKALMERYDNYALSISATTRNPRNGEADGREYFFRTVEEFEKMIAQEELIEYAKYVDNYYGTPKAYVMEQLQAGKDVVLEIEIQGALKVKEKFPDTLLLFVTPPSAEELKRRLIGRGTETMDVIKSRLERAVEESQGMDKYDYLVNNDDFETCVQEMHRIIQAEHDRVFRNGDFISRIRKELEAMGKEQ